MGTIFIISENSKTLEAHRSLLNFADKIILKRSDKYVALSNLSMYYTWKNIKQLYKNNKFKVSALLWNEKFDLTDRSFFVSDIQDYFVYILKKRGENIDNPIIRFYVNKIENRITFKIKTGYYIYF